MKQLDLILCAVAIVIGIVGSWVVWATKQPPAAAPQVKNIDVNPIPVPPASISYSTSLPGGQGGAMGRGGKGKAGFVG